MATGKHMGKVLLRVREEETNKNAKPVSIKIEAVPRHIPSKTGSYVITGGLGGFGLELTDWLVLRGATKILLNSRRGITTGYQSMRINLWRSYGIDVVVCTDDSTTRSGCRRIIEKANELGPVEAIFNLSVVLRDALFDNQTPENFAASITPKAVTTMYLDEISRELCPHLRNFVIFSSVSCGRGNPGQSNYGMANAIMERICEKRKEAGFPALAIEWGAIGDVGIVADLQEENTELVISGTLQQRISSCLSTLDKFMTQNETIVESMVVAEKKGGAGGADNIIDAVANILGIKDLKTISINATLAEVGMDSIMAVEIKQTLERDFEVFLTAQDIRSMTFVKLHEIASTKSVPAPDATETAQNDIQSMFKTLDSIKTVHVETAYKPFMILKSQVVPDSKKRILLIPGIEGFATSVEPLASRLDAITVCLQPMVTDKSSTIEEMAAALLQPALDNLDANDDSFIIVGYSFGAVLCLELVSLLEALGKVGDVILIDGSPDMLKKMASETFDTLSQEMFENSIIFLIISLVLNEEQVKFLKDMYEKLDTWDEKLNCLVENKPQDLAYDTNFIKAFCEVFYKRIKAIRNYKPDIPKIKSSVKLINPKQNITMFDTDDLGLSRFTTNPVDVIKLEGTHISIVENVECANEINKSIHAKIIIKESIREHELPTKYEAVRT